MGLTRVCAKRYRVGCEWLEGVGGEVEGWVGKWSGRMVEIVARRSEVAEYDAVVEFRGGSERWSQLAR